MDKPFSDIHASLLSQLEGKEESVPDTLEIKELRSKEPTLMNLMELGKALSFSLRYREAIDVYKKALEIDKDNLKCKRLLAGRYLSTLQLDSALEVFSWCLSHGGDALDIRYRRGLAYYYKGEYRSAKNEFECVMDLSNPEMKIALIYWHSLSSLKLGEKPSMVNHEIRKCDVGHHRSYFDGVAYLSGEISEEELVALAESEECDMEYSIKMYALYVVKRDKVILRKILRRGEYWFCFSSLAAWNEIKE